MAITNLPQPPLLGTDKGDDYVLKHEAFTHALANVFVDEVNETKGNIDSMVSGVEISAKTANATIFTSGNSYAIGDVVWSDITMQSYRCNTANSESLDPSYSTKWTVITGGQYQDLDIIYSGDVKSIPMWLPCDGSFFDTDVYTKLSTLKAYNIAQNTATLPTVASSTSAITSDGVYCVVGSGSSPYFYWCKNTNGTITNLTAPSELPTGAIFDMAWDSTNTYLAVAHNTTPFITIYKRTSNTLTKLTNPSTLPTGVGRSVAWNSGGTYLAVGHDTSPFITVYSRITDTFTKLTNPSTLPNSSIYTMKFLKMIGSSEVMLCSTTSSPYKYSCTITSGVVTSSTVPTQAHTSYFLSSSYNETTNRLILCGNNQNPMIYNCNTSPITYVSSVGSNSIKTAAYNTNGSKLLCGTISGIDVYDSSSGVSAPTLISDYVKNESSTTHYVSAGGDYMISGIGVLPYIQIFKESGATPNLPLLSTAKAYIKTGV